MESPKFSLAIDVSNTVAVNIDSATMDGYYKPMVRLKRTLNRVYYTDRYIG